MKQFGSFFAVVSVVLFGCDNKSSSSSAAPPWCPQGSRAHHGKCETLPASISFSEMMFQTGASGLDGYRGVATVGNAIYTISSLWDKASTGTVSAVRAVAGKAAEGGWQSTLSTSAEWSQAATLKTDGTSLYAIGTVYGAIRNGVTAFGDADVFIAKLNPSDGSVGNAVQVGTADVEWAEDAAIDVAHSAIYIVGSTNGTISGATSLGNRDMFVARYDLALSSATPQWVRQLGSSVNDEGRRIALDASGNLFVTGFTLEPDSANLAITGGEDVVVWSLNPVSGEEIWKRRIETKGSDLPSGLVVDSSGNPVVIGATNGKLAEAVYGGWDIFATKLSADTGQTLWGPIQYGTRYDESPESALVSADNGKVYVVGSTSGNFEGKGGALGRRDGFVAEISLSDGVMWKAKQAGSLARDEFFSAARLGDSLIVVGESDGNITKENVDGMDAFWLEFSLPF